MIRTNAIAVVLFLAGPIFCQGQSGKSRQSQIPDFDPQLLNYQLQQLALQQFSGQQYDSQSSQYAGQQVRQSQIPHYDSQSVQYAQPAQQYETQSGQQRGFGGQSQQLTQQDYELARLLQTKLFEPYQGQFGNIQSQAGQYTAQQSQQPAAQTTVQQQLPKQQLLGVAYSSAADASKTSFTGYGVKYSF